MVEHHHHELTPQYVLHRFRKLLARRKVYGLPGTMGDFKTNFIECLKNEHTVASIWLAHPLHPFSRNERIFYLANTMCFVFMIAAFTSSVNGWVSILVTVFLVIPYKSLARTVLECPCFYTGGYDESAEKDDGDDDPLNNSETPLKKMVEAVGGVVSIALSAASVAYLVIGIIYVSVAAPANFVASWISSQITSICCTELLSLAFFVALGTFVTNDGDKFRAKWGPYFPEKEHASLVSITQVAIKAKIDYISINGPNMFKRKYKDYDEWFSIPPENTVSHLNFDAEAQLSFQMDEQEQAGQFNHFQMVYTENPMAAAVTVKKKDKSKNSHDSSSPTLSTPSRAPSKSLADSPASAGTMANAVTIDDRKRATKATRKEGSKERRERKGEKEGKEEDKNVDSDKKGKKDKKDKKEAKEKKEKKEK